MVNQVQIDQDCDIIISKNIARILLFCALAALPVFLLAYVLYLLIKDLKRYYRMRNEFMQKVTATKIDPLYRSDNDNEVYSRLTDETNEKLYNEYVLDNINKNIDGVLNEAKLYNEAVGKFSKNILKKDAPIDVIDRTSMIKENDEW